MSKNSLVIELKDAYNKSREIFTNARNKNKNLSDINSLNENQHIAHGLSWYATYVESLLQLSNWIEYLETNNRLTDLEEGIAGVGAGEYCQQIIHGIPMSQNETIRPDELGIPREQIEDFIKITKSLTQRSTSFEKNRVMSLLQQSIESGIQPDDGLDETYKEIKKLDSTIEGMTRVKLFEDPDALKDLYNQIDKYTLKNNSSLKYLKSKIFRNKDH